MRHGNAVRFTPRDLRKGRLAPIVAGLLTDAGMRRAARQLQPLAEPVGAENAARRIIDLTGASPCGRIPAA